MMLGRYSGCRPGSFGLSQVALKTSGLVVHYLTKGRIELAVDGVGVIVGRAVQTGLVAGQYFGLYGDSGGQLGGAQAAGLPLGHGQHGLSQAVSQHLQPDGGTAQSSSDADFGGGVELAGLCKREVEIPFLQAKWKQFVDFLHPQATIFFFLGPVEPASQPGFAATGLRLSGWIC